MVTSIANGCVPSNDDKNKSAGRAFDPGIVTSFFTGIPSSCNSLAIWSLTA
jgi:hypothetical protein